MSDWLIHLSHSLTDQAGTWFVGLVLALLGVFSGRLVETVKFALNRADLRTKYYEQMATEISHFVFIVDRLTRVYYGSSWASEDDKSAIATEYNDLMNKISREEYVYLSWLRRYWRKSKSNSFMLTMDKIRDVDTALIHLNEHPEDKALLTQLESAFRDLQRAARALLVTDR
jgi:hypothetical protein